MKKISLMISAAIFAVAGFFFAGCEEGDDVTEVLAGPTNTWCKMKVEYKTDDTTSSQTANLYAYFYYTETAQTVGKAELVPGLNLVITRQDESASSIISELTDSVYFLKTFPKDEETSVSDSSDSSVIKVNGSRAKWSAIYWGKDELHDAQNKTTTAPEIVKNGTPITELTNIQNFSLKRLQANYLLTLLEE